jgi:hypothetical protein
MMEVFGRPEDIPVWRAAARGQDPDWPAFLREFTAAVDWPASAYWRKLSEAFPDALVLLSLRADPDAWWASISNTIFSDTVIRYRTESPFAPGWPHDLITAWFTPSWQNEDEAKAAYLRHNHEVRAGVAPGRLLEWLPGDGWEPICGALEMPVPDEPFPHVNTTAMFLERSQQMHDAGPLRGS